MGKACRSKHKISKKAWGKPEMPQVGLGITKTDENMIDINKYAIYIRRPLPERERVRLHCHPPIPCNPAESNQPLLQYLAIIHSAICNLSILQNAPCLIASS